MNVTTGNCMKGKCLPVVHIMLCTVRPPSWVDLLLLLPVVYPLKNSPGNE